MMTTDDAALLRNLLKDELPRIRREYVRIWEALASSSLTIQKRREWRDRAGVLAASNVKMVEMIQTVVDAAKESKTLSSDDHANAKLLVEQLTRFQPALEKMVTLSAIGVSGASDLSPEAVGCGKRYRKPTTDNTSSRASSWTVKPKRDSRRP